jgi:hypothetical protein
MLVITATQTVRATETTNLLNNGSFDNQTEGWELDGNVDYDGKNYGDLNQSVRFSGSDGGSITQSIVLDNVAEQNKEVTSISGSLISIGCNNEGNSWCNATGTANNLDPVNITMTLNDGTNSEVLTHNLTSDFNDGVITSNYSVDVTNTFETANTSLTVNYAGADTGNKVGQFGTIIDDLSVSLTLSDIIITPEPEIPEISPIVAPEAIPSPIVDDIVVNPVVIEPIVVDPVIIEPVVVDPVVIEPVVIEPVVIEPVAVDPVVIIEPIIVEPVVVEPIVAEPIIIEPVPIEIVAIEPVVVETIEIGSLDATSIVNTISSGVIDINPPEDVQIANLSPQISVISDIRTEQMNMDMADVGINNEMPTNIDVGADVPVDNNMQEIDMPDLTDMPTIEMPDVQMPDALPEINDIQIESVNEIQNEPETLQEIREEIPENNIEELPAELEETNMEEDLKENQNEQQEETSNENEEIDGANEESDLSGDSASEEKEPEAKEEIKEIEEKESEEKEESSEKEIKDEPVKNEEKVVKSTKSSKSEKKQGSDSSKSSDKKKSVTTVTPKIKSDIVVQKLDLLTVVSFNKEYFEVKITDTLDLTKTEIDFYEGQGFNDSTYAQNNIDFFALDCQSDCWGNIHVRTNAIKIDSFRR